MDELKQKQAYERLGLPEDATREQIEQRFELLLRQSRSRSKQESSEDGPDSTHFDEVIKAYRYITESQNQQKYDELTKQRYAKYKGFAGTAEKIDDFLRHYKVHVIVSLIAIIAIIFGINSYLDHQAEKRYQASLPPIDLSVIVIGNFAVKDNGDDEELDQAILSQFPEWQRTSVTLTYLPMQEGNMTNIAYQQKAMLVLTTEKPDMYIMDKESFEWVASSGVLRSLDGEDKSFWQPLLASDLILKQQTEEDEQPRIYGIDLSKSKSGDDLPLLRSNEDLIVGVRFDTSKEAQVFQFIQRYEENMR